jgi:hypothetical protein
MLISFSGYYTVFGPEDGGSMYLRNVGEIAHVHTV